MDILLLHGAIGAASQLTALRDVLPQNCKTHLLDFTGHGERETTPAEFSIKLFADDVLAYMAANNISKATIVGYSMGGYVGMYLAVHHPEKIDSIVTLATKYHWDEATSAKEVQMLNPEKIALKLPDFAATLEARHRHNDWKDVLAHTAGMMLQMGADNPLRPADYPAIRQPVLVMLGDRDKMVTMDETIAVYKALPNAQLCILPGTPHPIEQVNIPMLAGIISTFLGH